MSDTLRVRVARKWLEAEGICGFELVALDGAALPAFSAGAHIDVHLPDGITRQYSLCNDPQETQRYCLGVLRDPASRGGSEAMHRAASWRSARPRTISPWQPTQSAACCWPAA